MTQLALALAPAAPFVDQLDEPYLYHDIERPGFTAFVTPGGDQRQISLPLNQLPVYLRKLQVGRVDAYIAQNEFFRRNRRAVNCWRLTSCYVDLDTYKLDSGDASATQCYATLEPDLQPATRTKAIENPRNREEARCARAGTRTNRSLGLSSRPTLA